VITLFKRVDLVSPVAKAVAMNDIQAQHEAYVRLWGESSVAGLNYYIWQTAPYELRRQLGAQPTLSDYGDLMAKPFFAVQVDTWSISKAEILSWLEGEWERLALPGSPIDHGMDLRANWSRGDLYGGGAQPRNTVRIQRARYQYATGVENEWFGHRLVMLRKVYP